MVYLVDDSIVVVENIERVMKEEGLNAKDATVKSMKEISGALIGIATVLSAVFLPMAFFDWSFWCNISSVFNNYNYVNAIISCGSININSAAAFFKPMEHKEHGFWLV